MTPTTRLRSHAGWQQKRPHTVTGSIPHLEKRQKVESPSASAEKLPLDEALDRIADPNCETTHCDFRSGSRTSTKKTSVKDPSQGGFSVRSTEEERFPGLKMGWNSHVSWKTEEDDDRDEGSNISAEDIETWSKERETFNNHSDERAVLRAFFEGRISQTNDDFRSLHLPALALKYQQDLKFPEKLMMLLVHVEHLIERAASDSPSAKETARKCCLWPAPCIRWETNGLAFNIHDPDKLTKCLIPLFFPQQTKFRSFTRKLYRWGFRRVNPFQRREDVKRVIRFAHLHFRREQPALIQNIESRQFEFARITEDSRANSMRISTNNTEFLKLHRFPGNSWPPSCPAPQVRFVGVHDHQTQGMAFTRQRNLARTRRFNQMLMTMPNVLRSSSNVDLDDIAERMGLPPRRPPRLQVLPIDVAPVLVNPSVMGLSEHAHSQGRLTLNGIHGQGAAQGYDLFELNNVVPLGQQTLPVTTRAYAVSRTLCYKDIGVRALQEQSDSTVASRAVPCTPFSSAAAATWDAPHTPRFAEDSLLELSHSNSAVVLPLTSGVAMAPNLDDV